MAIGWHPAADVPHTLHFVSQYVDFADHVRLALLHLLDIVDR